MPEICVCVCILKMCKKFKVNRLSNFQSRNSDIDFNFERKFKVSDKIFPNVIIFIAILILRIQSHVYSFCSFVLNIINFY